MFDKMINEFNLFFEQEYNISFSNQTNESCKAIYDLCLKFKPEKVIEIGTNHGASTFSILLAMKKINRDSSNILSIDLDHNKWKKSFYIQRDFIQDNKLEPERVKILTSDFNSICPNDLVDGSKFFVFYDIHDHRAPWSLKFLNSWVPLFKEAMILIHDISDVDPSFQLIYNKNSPMSKKKYYDGTWYAGFMECERIIDWANVNKVKLIKFNGGIYFLCPL